MAYKLTWETDECLTNYSGIFSDEDLIGAHRDMHADPRFMTIHRQLCDMSMVSKFELTSEAIRSTARLDEEISQRFPGRQIAIVTDDPVGFGLARMYQLHAPRAQWDFQLFRSRREARAWLLQHAKVPVR